MTFFRVLAMASLVGCATVPPAVAPGPCPTAALNQPAPKFSLLLNDGSVGVSLAAALRQHLPVVVNFWSVSCKPCLAELPAFQRVASELEGKVTFLLVHVGEDEARMKLGVHLPSAADTNQTVAGDYCAVDVIPRTFIIDTRGVIRAVLPSLDEATLRRELAKVD
jgi:peroxiredoxin